MLENEIKQIQISPQRIVMKIKWNEICYVPGTRKWKNIVGSHQMLVCFILSMLLSRDFYSGFP